MYEEIKRIEFIEDEIIRIYHLALDKHAQTRIRAAAADLSTLEKDDLVSAMIDLGVVLHNPVDAEGKPLPAVQWLDNRRLSKPEIMRQYWQDGRLQNPAPGIRAVLRRDRETLQVKNQASWEYGLLQDPAPGVPAIVGFGPDEDEVESLKIKRNRATLETEGYPDAHSIENQMEFMPTFHEKFRAHYQKGVPSDPSECIPGEQVRNPGKNSLYAAWRNSTGKYASPGELHDLSQKLPPLPQPEPHQKQTIKRKPPSAEPQVREGTTFQI